MCHRSPAADPVHLARLCPARYQRAPVQSWAYDPNVPDFPYNPEKARQILDAAGYPATNGVRFHLTMKTSTEESTRLLAAVLQQQLRAVACA